MMRFAAVLGLGWILVLLAAVPSGSAVLGQERQINLILNRLAFGSTAEDLDHVRAIGVERYITEQLDPDAIPEPIELRVELAQFDTIGLSAVELRRRYGPPRPRAGAKPTPDEIKLQRERARIVLQEAEEARVLKAILSRRQLQQVMVDFWFNHFNVFSGKGLAYLWIGDYEQQAIRPFALGRFRDLLFAVAKHPAMLVYLDSTRSTAPGSPGARGGETGLNENFAREVMELHTLGVDGGYTQEDVVTLARVFTGWAVNRSDGGEFPDHAAVFEGSRHDYGPKVLLGRPLRSRGKAEGEEALAMLAANPVTARHISFELAQYLVADDPPPVLVERLAARFQETDGNIREVLRTLFASREFRDSYGQKYKTPYQFVVSAARAASVPAHNVRPLIDAMSQLGMPLYGCQTPDGYANTEEAWLSPDAMTRRINFATMLARGTLPISWANPRLFDLLPQAGPARPVDPNRLMQLVGTNLTPATKDAISSAAPRLRAALVLGSPDFMRR